MTWRTDVQQTVWNVGSDIKSFSDKLTSEFSSLVDSTASGVGNLLNGTSLIGINVNQIPNMKNAIRNYVATLDSHLKEVATNADTSNAFRGDYATAIRIYVEEVTEACKKLITQLLMFNDKLTEIEDAYNKHQEKLSSNIRGTAANVESSYTRYEEKYK